jgi:hypothetical protein
VLNEQDEHQNFNKNTDKIRTTISFVLDDTNVTELACNNMRINHHLLLKNKESKGNNSKDNKRR